MSTALEQLTRQDVPVEETWDLTSYYPDDAAFEADLARIPGLVETAAAHQGKLGESAQELRKALDDSMAVREVVSRAASYAHLRKDENVADPAIGAGAAERAGSMPEAVKRAVHLAADPMRDAWVRNALAFTKAHRGTVNRVVGALLALITTRSGGGGNGVRAASSGARVTLPAPRARALLTR